jgi:hypothetical protein
MCSLVVVEYRGLSCYCKEWLRKWGRSLELLPIHLLQLSQPRPLPNRDDGAGKNGTRNHDVGLRRSGTTRAIGRVPFPNCDQPMMGNGFPASQCIWDFVLSWLW